MSTWQLLGVWMAIIVACALYFWIANHWADHALFEGGQQVGTTVEGFFTALYFSAVTATTLGYGDVMPHGLARVVALFEAAAGLLLFGAMVSKFVSRRQELLTEEIHRLTFENRLGRVQANLSLVISDLQSVCSDFQRGHLGVQEASLRVESLIMVFTSALRSVHDILYRPQQRPDEQTLENVLASVAAALQELTRACNQLQDVVTFQMSLRQTATLAEQICGECVPQEYAPNLTRWMDQIQQIAATMTQASVAPH